jgi:cyclophilin family peptidyl-prolyl cis-trans isomerase
MKQSDSRQNQSDIIKPMNKESIGIIIFFVVLLGGILFWSNKTSQKTEEAVAQPTQVVQKETEKTQETTPSENLVDLPNMQYSNPPEMQIDQSKKYTALIKTSEGDLTLELNASETPITVNNFVFLAGEGYYNDTIFHRVIEGFMIQGGDPEGTGMGGPGYEFDDESFSGEYDRGVIAMANAGPNTNGSQFFIMHKSYPLPKNYVIFGKVTEGMEVVDKIATAPTKPNITGENSTPVNPVKVLSAEITEE